MGTFLHEAKTVFKEPLSITTLTTPHSQSWDKIQQWMKAILDYPKLCIHSSYQWPHRQSFNRGSQKQAQKTATELITKKPEPKKHAAHVVSMLKIYKKKKYSMCEPKQKKMRRICRKF